MKLKLLLLIFVLILITLKTKAQKDKEIKTQILWSLIEHYNTIGAEVFAQKAYQNKAFAFGLAIRVNDKGVVDTVLFTNKTPTLDSLVSFKSIVKMLKGKRATQAFSNYKNTVFVTVALVRKSWEHTIENVEEFDNYFYNLLPDITDISHLKQIKILPAFGMVQARRQY